MYYQIFLLFISLLQYHCIDIKYKKLHIFKCEYAVIISFPEIRISNFPVFAQMTLTSAIVDMECYFKKKFLFKKMLFFMSIGNRLKLDE